MSLDFNEITGQFQPQPEEENSKSKRAGKADRQNVQELYNQFRYLSLGNAALYDRYKVLKELCRAAKKLSTPNEWEDKLKIWQESLKEYEDSLIQKVRDIPSVPFWNHSIGRYNGKILGILNGIENRKRYPDWKALHRHFRNKILFWWIFVVSVFLVSFFVYRDVTIRREKQNFRMMYAECSEEFKSEIDNFQVDRLNDFVANCRRINIKAKKTAQLSQFLREEKKQINELMTKLSDFIGFAETCQKCVQNEQESLEDKTVRLEKMMPESDFNQMIEKGSALGQKHVTKAFKNHREEIQNLAKLESMYQDWKDLEADEPETLQQEEAEDQETLLEEDDEELEMPLEDEEDPELLLDDDEEEPDTPQQKEDQKNKTLQRLEDAKPWLAELNGFQADFCKKQFERDSVNYQKDIRGLLVRENIRFTGEITKKLNETKFKYEDRVSLNIKAVDQICKLESSPGFSLFKNEFQDLKETLKKAKDELNKVLEGTKKGERKSSSSQKKSKESLGEMLEGTKKSERKSSSSHQN